MEEHRAEGMWKGALHSSVRTWWVVGVVGGVVGERGALEVAGAVARVGVGAVVAGMVVVAAVIRARRALFEVLEATSEDQDVWFVEEWSSPERAVVDIFARSIAGGDEAPQALRAPETPLKTARIIRNRRIPLEEARQLAARLEMGEFDMLDALELSLFSGSAALGVLVRAARHARCSGKLRHALVLPEGWSSDSVFSSRAEMGMTIPEALLDDSTAVCLHDRFLSGFDGDEAAGKAWDEWSPTSSNVLLAHLDSRPNPVPAHFFAALTRTRASSTLVALEIRFTRSIFPREEVVGLCRQLSALRVFVARQWTGMDQAKRATLIVDALEAIASPSLEYVACYSSCTASVIPALVGALLKRTSLKALVLHDFGSLHEPSVPVSEALLRLLECASASLECVNFMNSAALSEEHRRKLRNAVLRRVWMTRGRFRMRASMRRASPDVESVVQTTGTP